MNSQPRNAGIDIMKAVCIILVIIWHVQPVTVVMLPAGTAFAIWGGRIIHLFYFNFSLLAVPTFILISLYLFIQKLSGAGDYWKKRFLRLFQIYVFWVGIQFILYLLTGGPLPLPLKTIIRSGGPDLNFGPLLPVMPSIFYYLYSLIFCTVLAFLFLKLPEKIKWLSAIVIIVGSCVYFLLTPSYGIAIDTRSMKNYYLYVPSAYLLYHYGSQFVRFRLLFFIGFLLSIIAESTFVGSMSAYGRLSIFLGALTFASFFISGWSAANRPMILLSRYSLGLFALHPYGLGIMVCLYALLAGKTAIYPPQTFHESFLLLGGTVGLTVMGVWLLSKTKLRMYIS
jgi:peptidoglycan/LPS O-acetylase OafA/YrhL